jgi:hypothetical protein
VSYSRAHYRRLSNGDKDTPETIAERVRIRAAAQQAVAERESRWPNLAAENAAEAIAWQEARIRELSAPPPAGGEKEAGR